MGWIETLYNSYNYLEQESERIKGSVTGLLPPAVIVQNAQVEVTLNIDGSFARANFVEKEDSKTNTPCTEKSASRTAKPEPHGLFDNIMYVAGDFQKFFMNDKKNKDIYSNNFLPYIEALRLWAESEFSSESVKAVYEYLKKETLVKDLIESKIIKLGKANIADVEKKHNGISPDKFFIRFAVQHNGERKKMWEDTDLLKLYSRYYLSRQTVQSPKSFCYVTGKTGYMSELHGKYIRFPGDGVKLISSNDSTNFTFRGRFDTPSEALNISYEVSEKAHSALRYLINRNAYKRNGLTVIAWADGRDVLNPAEDTFSIFDAVSERSELTVVPAETSEDFAKNLSQALSGYYSDLETPIKVNLMVVDAASPGRMAVQYFKSFEIDDYIDRITKWHSDLSWERWYKRTPSEKAKLVFGAPSPYDICISAFGHEQEGRLVINEKNKFVNAQIRRILSCIVEGSKLPSEFMRSAYRNAINPPAIKEEYNWLECLRTSCSLIKKYYMDRGRKEIYMALDKKKTERSYLFGRLLAVADRVEEVAFYRQNRGSDEPVGYNGSGKRLTAAKRYMNIFAKRPASIWVNINAKLNPYWTALPANQQSYYRNLIGEICDLFEYDDFKSKKALEPSFLLGYYQQKKELQFNQNKTEEEL